MTNDQPQHPGTDDLLAYVTETLPAEETRVIAEHLASCDDCSESASRAFRLSTIWQDWRHRVIGEEDLATRVAAALRKVFDSASLTQATLRERVDLSGGLLGALTLGFEQLGVLPAVSVGKLEALLSPSAPFRILAPAGVLGRAAVGQQNPEALEFDIFSESTDAKARVEVRDGGALLRIQLREWPANKPPPVAVVIRFFETVDPESQMIEFTTPSLEASVRLDVAAGKVALVFVPVRQLHEGV